MCNRRCRRHGYAYTEAHSQRPSHPCSPPLPRSATQRSCTGGVPTLAFSSRCCVIPSAYWLADSGKTIEVGTARDPADRKQMRHAREGSAVAAGGQRQRRQQQNPSDAPSPACGQQPNTGSDSTNCPIATVHAPHLAGRLAGPGPTSRHTPWTGASSSPASLRRFVTSSGCYVEYSLWKG